MGSGQVIDFMRRHHFTSRQVRSKRLVSPLSLGAWCLVLGAWCLLILGDTRGDGDLMGGLPPP